MIVFSYVRVDMWECVWHCILMMHNVDHSPGYVHKVCVTLLIWSCVCMRWTSCICMTCVVRWLWLCVWCVWVWVNTYVCTRGYTWTAIHALMCMCMQAGLCTYVCMCVCSLAHERKSENRLTYVYIRIVLCMRVYICVWECVCGCVFVMKDLHLSHFCSCVELT